MVNRSIRKDVPTQPSKKDAFQYHSLNMLRNEMPSSSNHHHSSSSSSSLRNRPSCIQRRILRNPSLARKLEQMALPLTPLVQLTTGAVHPAFPRTVLNFWLLSDHQLEALAQFYHQKVPGSFTAQYPCPVVWDSSLPLEEKRRKMGKFIGLRGCESPILLKTEEEIAADARRARMASEDEMWRRKMFPWQ